MSRTKTTRRITASTCIASAPRDLLPLERRALELLTTLDDGHMVEVSVKGVADEMVDAVFPVALLRRYLQAQEVEGRELLLFDADETVTSEVAAKMLGVSRPHLNELLDAAGIRYSYTGNQRRIFVSYLKDYMERRDQRAEGLAKMAAVTNESAGG